MSEHKLTASQQRSLAGLEDIIERGEKTFIEVGIALATIRDNQLYLGVSDTFEGYGKKRWGFGKTHIYRLIGSAKVVETLSPMGDIDPPQNERQARILAEIKDENQQADVWAQAVKTSPIGSDGARHVTAAHISKVAKEMLGAPPASNGKPHKPESPEEHSPATAVDALKQPVDENIAEIFTEGCPQFKDAMQRCSDLKRDIRKMAAEQFGGWLDLQENERHIDQLRHNLRFAMPYTECVKCRRQPKKGCPHCKGSGWLNESMFSSCASDSDKEWLSKRK